MDPTKTEWLNSLPPWMQTILSIAVFFIAVGAGLYGFMQQMRKTAPQAAVDVSPKVVLEQASLADSRPMLSLLEEVRKTNALHERLVTALEQIAEGLAAEREQAAFDRRVAEEVARRSSPTDRRRPPAKE